ncbi:porin family protein [Massilia niastensis]|uniref:porin family protein n=1 Tax=Massilia niastensis TaxID=544911 RepID=UPI00036672DA|nr:porin family protein [Massilia niastensis]
MFKHIAVAAALVISSSAFAAAPGTFYAGVDAGETKFKDWSDRETSYGFFAGYNFLPNVALEGGFRRLGEADAFGVDVKADQVALSLVGSLPIATNLDLYGRLGYNRIDVDVKSRGFSGSDSESRALYGIGLGYAFSPQISGRVEVQKPTSDTTNVSAGVVFNF